MPFPPQTDLEVPLLRFIDALGGEARPKQVYEPLAEQFHLTPEERREAMESTGANRWENTVQWVRQRLVVTGDLDPSTRGIWRLTAAGRKRAATGAPVRREPAAPVPSRESPLPPARRDDRTPSEIIDKAHRELREALAAELLQVVRSCSPAFFERLVIDVLVKMGYGGTRRDAARILGRSGDGGIDGVINEDRLGLESVYVQAKRWREAATIPSSEIRDFIGALAGRHAKKGVFITTATFSREAQAAAERAGDFRVVLIDGGHLAKLMIELGVGVSAVASYDVQRIDSDYFTDDGS